MKTIRLLLLTLFATSTVFSQQPTTTATPKPVFNHALKIDVSHILEGRTIELKILNEEESWPQAGLQLCVPPKQGWVAVLLKNVTQSVLLQTSADGKVLVVTLRDPTDLVKPKAALLALEFQIFAQMRAVFPSDKISLVMFMSNDPSHAWLDRSSSKPSPVKPLKKPRRQRKQVVKGQ